MSTNEVQQDFRSEQTAVQASGFEAISEQATWSNGNSEYFAASKPQAVSSTADLMLSGMVLTDTRAGSNTAEPSTAGDGPTAQPRVPTPPEFLDEAPDTRNPAADGTLPRNPIKPAYTEGFLSRVISEHDRDGSGTLSMSELIAAAQSANTSHSDAVLLDALRLSWTHLADPKTNELSQARLANLSKSFNPGAEAMSLDAGHFLGAVARVEGLSSANPTMTNRELYSATISSMQVPRRRTENPALPGTAPLGGNLFDQIRTPPPPPPDAEIDVWMPPTGRPHPPATPVEPPQRPQARAERQVEH